MRKEIVNTLAWPGLKSHYARLRPHEGATVTHPNQIGVSLSRHRGLVQQHAGRERETDVAAGALFVTGEDPITWIRVREHTEALEMYPDLGFVARLAGADVNRLVITPALGAGDPVILSVAMRFRAAHAAGALIGDVEGSELALRVALRLLDRHTDIQLDRGWFSGSLDARRLSRVCEFIEAELGDAIAVSDLADIAALSPAHFSRAFRRTTGLSPQKYVTLRRLARAKEQLLESGASVANVAGNVGFSNLSHFRRQFRAHYGVAPGELRA
jgi:AraC family transcriptional regulator